MYRDGAVRCRRPESGTNESVLRSLARERAAPRIVALSTPGRIVEATFLEPREGGRMETVITRCAGLEVDKATVVATVGVHEAGGRRIGTETVGRGRTAGLG